ncbi:serine/threonine dehydratase [Marinicella meishanensis]|uniref:serine/threonine dehydratase n=1 Tax=Marinicella meishanensis TaxID=2873263 RepID=UPI001CBF25B6|nr:serine/threonine dehydratase [Marinicella sp. NBU2979]
MITIQDIQAAHQRILPHINHTPVVTSSRLNHWLGHEIHFKVECLQKVGAFKARGGCNAVQVLREQQPNIRQVVANSSGNHGQAVAWAASLFGLPAAVYMPTFASQVKAQAIRDYGAEVVALSTRQAVDQAVADAAQADGVHWIPPFNDWSVIAGQGTAMYEALQQIDQPLDAVFAPCGGGGLISGTLVATRHAQARAQVFAVEPKAGDDAMRSYLSGQIQHLDDAPKTLADGAMTLSVGEKTFAHIQQLDGFFAVEESPMAYWTQWLQHLLKLHVEPTSAMVMDGVCQWLRGRPSKPSQKIMVVLSGGNIDAKTMQKIWQTDHLVQTPRVDLGWP